MQFMRGIVNSYSHHYNVNNQAYIMSSKIKTNLNGKEGSDLVTNDNSFLFIRSAWPHMPLYANFGELYFIFVPLKHTAINCYNSLCTKDTNLNVLPMSSIASGDFMLNGPRRYRSN